MERSQKDAWLAPGAGDLRERDVEDVPVKGQSVRVRALPAAYSNEASSKALVYETYRGEQRARVDTGKLEVLQFAHGVIDPQFSVEEAEQIAKTFGPAFRRVIEVIDEISGVDKEAIEEAEVRFQPGGPSEAGASLETPNGSGDGGPVVPARAGVGAGQERA
jgi:hypothetical protein